MPFKKYYTDLERTSAVEELKDSIIALEYDVTKIHQNLKRIAREIYYLYDAMASEEYEGSETKHSSPEKYSRPSFISPLWAGDFLGIYLKWDITKVLI